MNNNPIQFPDFACRRRKNILLMKNVLPFLASPWDVSYHLWSQLERTTRKQSQKREGKRIKSHHPQGIRSLPNSFPAVGCEHNAEGGLPSTACPSSPLCEWGVYYLSLLLNANTQTAGKCPSAIPRQALPRKARES